MHVDKVYTVLLKPDDMEKVNKLTGINPFATDNWCGLWLFAEVPELYDFVSEDEIKLIEDRKADFIAFRLDI